MLRSRDHGLGLTVVGLGLGLMEYLSQVSYALVSWSKEVLCYLN